MAISRQLQIDLTTGYLFRPTTLRGGVRDAPFSLAAEALFKVYLKEMVADDGETLHGFRSGCAINLALSSAECRRSWTTLGGHDATLCYKFEYFYW